MPAGRLLICDDEPEICALVRQIGEALGYDVCSVTDPLAFNDAYNEDEPQLVVLDIVMPGRDGIEIVGWLAKQHYGGKVVLISGYDPNYSRTAQVLAECQGLNISAILRKPVPIKQLREALAA